MFELSRKCAGRESQNRAQRLFFFFLLAFPLFTTPFDSTPSSF